MHLQIIHRAGMKVLTSYPQNETARRIHSSNEFEFDEKDIKTTWNRNTEIERFKLILCRKSRKIKENQGHIFQIAIEVSSLGANIQRYPRLKIPDSPNSVQTPWFDGGGHYGVPPEETNFKKPLPLGCMIDVCFRLRVFFCLIGWLGKITL